MVANFATIPHLLSTLAALIGISILPAGVNASSEFVWLDITQAPGYDILPPTGWWPQ